MNVNNDHGYYKCTVKHISGGAILVELHNNGQERWVPKNLCDLKHSEPRKGTICILEVEQWFADKGKFDEA